MIWQYKKTGKRNRVLFVPGPTLGFVSHFLLLVAELPVADSGISMPHPVFYSYHAEHCIAIYIVFAVYESGGPGVPVSWGVDAWKSEWVGM